MSVEENKVLAQRFIDSANAMMGNPDNISSYIEEFFTPDFILHLKTGDLNIQQFEALEHEALNSHPNVRHSIVKLVSEEDMVVIQRKTSVVNQEFQAVDICKVKDGKFVEMWVFSNRSE